MVLTRRKFLASSAASAGLLGAAVAGLSACDSGSAATTSGAGIPVRGGTLSVGVSAEPDSWNVHVAASSLAALLLRGVYDSLVHQKADGTFEPWLAKSWSVSSDGLRYTFTLRDDVTFTDGTAFNAQAVKANFDDIVAPATQSRYASSLIGPYDSAEVIGEHIAQVRLTAPYSPFLMAASTPYLGFHSPRLLGADRAKIGSGGKNVVSTGPFLFTSLTPGEQAVFTRRPEYAWAPASIANHGSAYLSGYTGSFLSEDETRIGSLTSGQLDVANEVPTSQLDELRKNSSVALYGRDDVGMPFTYCLNVTKAPFTDIRVRQAFQSAVNTASITSGLFQGAYSAAKSVLTPATPGYSASAGDVWGYSPTRAKTLLDAAGYTGTNSQGYRTRDGQALSVDLVYASDYTTQDELNYHTALQAALATAGIELTLRPLSTSAIVGAFSDGDYHLGAFALGTPDPSVLYSAFYSTELPSVGGSNVSRVDDPQLDSWLKAALASQDITERAALYGNVQQRVLAQGLALPAYVSTESYGALTQVHGMSLDVQDVPWFDVMWIG